MVNEKTSLDHLKYSTANHFNYNRIIIKNCSRPILSTWGFSLNIQITIPLWTRVIFDKKKTSIQITNSILQCDLLLKKVGAHFLATCWTMDYVTRVILAAIKLHFSCVSVCTSTFLMTFSLSIPRSVFALIERFMWQEDDQGKFF